MVTSTFHLRHRAKKKEIVPDFPDYLWGTGRTADEDDDVDDDDVQLTRFESGYILETILYEPMS